MSDLAAIVEDAIIEALERGVNVCRRPLRVELDWSELARLYGPYGSRFRVLQRNGDPTSGVEIQFVAADLADAHRAAVERAEAKGEAPPGVTLQ